MESELKEECGIVGVYEKNSRSAGNLITHYLHQMLKQVQHRGQLSAGIAVYNPFKEKKDICTKPIRILKKLGKADDLFASDDIEKYFKGVAGIGHVRYSTSGAAQNPFDQYEEAQPFYRHHGRSWKRFALSFNGNLANYEALKNELPEDYILDTTVDTEIIAHLLSLNLNRLSENGAKPDLFEVYNNLMRKLDGAYNLLSLTGDGDMIVTRDPLGFKPLVWGENPDLFAVASESVALEKIGIKNFYPIESGSCTIFNKSGIKSKLLYSDGRTAHCEFELVYFARADSFIDGKSVNSIRENLGKNLAKADPLKEKGFDKRYVVVPVPKTAIPAAEGYAREAGLPWTMAIDRVDSVRGFINKSSERKAIMDFKYSIIPERVRGKIVILIEDSIVRGETSKKTIKMVRESGAAEVHLRSTEPPIISPCFYGIDFPTYGELIATRYKENLEENVAKEIGADSVLYQTIEGLVDATGFRKNQLCLACLNGKYPTDAGRRAAEMLQKI